MADGRVTGLHPYLEHLLSIWREELAGPRRRFITAAWFLVLFGGAHVARVGTPAYRAATATAMLLVIAGWLISGVRRSRIERDARRALRAMLTASYRPIANKAERALDLVERTKVDPSAGSPELAELHWTRSLREITPDVVRASSARRARVMSVLAGVSAAGVLAAVALGPSRVVEGLDVLVARGPVAPMALDFLDGLEVQVHPPEYLKQKDYSQRGLAPIDVPYGSLLTVRGVPLRSDRALVLTDGDTEIAFVDDGGGGVTARWPVRQTTSLRVGARFGDVRIEQDESFIVTSIADAPPVVELEGAPRVVRLIEESEIPILYRATDDHGLTQIELVLKSGTREERRLLGKLEQEVVHDQGGVMLRSGDRFFQGAFLPIEVTVQARDNDPLTGPKWGVSAAITLMPPTLGEPEAMRFVALSKIRDELLAKLSEHVVANEPTTSKELRGLIERERRELLEVATRARQVMGQRFGSLEIPRRAKTLVDAQFRKIDDAMAAAEKSPSKTSRGAARTAIEDATLAVDSALSTLAVRDAQSVARRLSKVAAEAADGLLAARGVAEGESIERGLQRAESALAVIDPSGKALRKLGVLGEDLGSIVANDLRRISRSRTEKNLLHAELAARDLAGRLAHPSPSFSGGSGSGHGGGAEAGGGAPDPGDSSASDAEEAMERGERELDQLSRDHSESVENIERAMREASEGEDNDALRELTRKHAEAVREAVKKLPRNAGDPDSPEGASASAREQAERMADALERGSPADAADAGKSAMKKLAEAEKLAKRDELFGEPSSKSSREAAGKVASELKWTEELLEQIKKRAQERAGVDGAAEREKSIADRAKELSERSRSGQAPAPGQAVDYLDGAESKMRDAVKSLKSGEVGKALEHQREAQKLLEMAKQQGQEGDARDEGTPQKSDDSSNGKQPSTGPEVIPKPDDYKGPEAFRLRVMEGLSQNGNPRLRGAVQRYTERLLK